MQRDVPGCSGSAFSKDLAAGLGDRADRFRGADEGAGVGDHERAEDRGRCDRREGEAREPLARASAPASAVPGDRSCAGAGC